MTVVLHGPLGLVCFATAKTLRLNAKWYDTSGFNRRVFDHGGDGRDNFLKVRR